jgi:hypothetical protein
MHTFSKYRVDAYLEAVYSSHTWSSSESTALWRPRIHLCCPIILRGKSVYTSGFWPRVRARALRAPVFLGALPRPTGRCAPPRQSQLRCSPKNIKNKRFPETKCLPSGPNSGRQGRICFHWVKLHSTELSCALVIYAAPYRSYTAL